MMPVSAIKVPNTARLSVATAGVSLLVPVAVRSPVAAPIVLGSAHSWNVAYEFAPITKLQK